MNPWKIALIIIAIALVFYLVHLIDENPIIGTAWGVIVLLAIVIYGLYSIPNNKKK